MRQRKRIVRDAAEAPRFVLSLGATPQKVIIALPADRVKLGRLVDTLILRDGILGWG
jgi:hypothetical protein